VSMPKSTACLAMLTTVPASSRACCTDLAGGPGETMTVLLEPPDFIRWVSLTHTRAERPALLASIFSSAFHII
jgi:hypothetical protein